MYFLKIKINISDVTKCLTFGGKAKIKIVDEKTTYSKVEDEEAFKKIGQLKKALNK